MARKHERIRVAITCDTENTSEAFANKPFIRWAGGKTRLLKRIVPHIPTSIIDYYEPFVGGGAVYFASQHRITGVAHLSDLNEDLICAWQIMGFQQKSLLPYFSEYQKYDSEEFYYRMRALTPSSEVEKAARFLYLNGTSWNHLWRENSKTGAMNVPWGKREFKGFTSEEMSRIANSLRGAKIEAKDFRMALNEVRAGDFVYLDPPYLPIFTNSSEKESTSKFNKYTARTFTSEDLKDLAAICDELTNMGAYWIMSNRDTSEIRNLFKAYRIERFTTRRSLAAQNKRNVEDKNSPEALIIGERI